MTRYLLGGGTELVPAPRLVVSLKAGKPQIQRWHQDPRRPGKVMETSPTAGQPGWACSESTSTSTNHHLDVERKEKGGDHCLYNGNMTVLSANLYKTMRNA